MDVGHITTTARVLVGTGHIKFLDFNNRQIQISQFIRTIYQFISIKIF